MISYELDGASVIEIANRLNLAPSDVHKHLSTLQEHRYIVNKKSEYRHRLRFLGLGGFTRYQMTLYGTAKPELKSVAEETGGKTINLVEEHGNGIFLDR